MKDLLYDTLTRPVVVAWLTPAELAGMGEMCAVLAGSATQLAEYACYDADAMQQRLAAICQEAFQRLQAAPADLDLRAALLPRLLQWMNLCDITDEMLDAVEREAFLYINMVRHTPQPEWKHVYAAVAMRLNLMPFYPNADEWQWTAQIVRPWLARLEAQGWQAEHLSLEQTLLRMAVIPLLGRPDLEARALRPFLRRATRDALQTELWHAHRAMPFHLVDGHAIWPLAQAHLAAHPDLPRSLRWHILATALAAHTSALQQEAWSRHASAAVG